MRAILRGSTESGNVGDRLMSAAAGRLLESMGFRRIYRFGHGDPRFDEVPWPGRITTLFDLGNVHYCDSWPRPLEDRLRNSIRFAAAFPRAKRVFLPSTWGPFPNELHPLLDSMTRGALVFARDQPSLEHLRKALGPARARFCPDLAFLCGPQDPAPGQRILERAGVPAGPLLGLIPNVRCVQAGVTPLKDPRVYRNLLERIVERGREHGLAVVGLSHMVQTDRDRRLLDGLGIPVVATRDAIEIRSVIANLTLAVSSRYHGLVNCFLHGVPAISIGWHHKYRGVMEIVGFSRFDHRLEDEAASLDAKLHELAGSRAELVGRIRTHVARARARIREEMGKVAAGFGQAEGFELAIPGASLRTPAWARRSKTRKRAVRAVRKLRHLFSP